MEMTAYQLREERPINATGKYNFEQFDLDELEIEDNFDEAEEASLDQSILASVRIAYGQVLHQATKDFAKQSSFQMKEEQNLLSGKQEIIAKRQRDKQIIEEAMGPELYQRLHDYLVHHRSQDPPTEPVYAEMKELTGNVKSLLTHAMRLDDIIFHEIVLSSFGSQAQL